MDNDSNIANNIANNIAIQNNNNVTIIIASIINSNKTSTVL